MSITTSSIARNAPLGVGFMLIGSGVSGIFRPLNTIRHFGLSWADESHSGMSQAVFVRNLSAGIATMILSLSGQRQSVGFLLASWIPVGLVDIYVIARDPRAMRGAAHVLNTTALTFVSALALLEGRYSDLLDKCLVTGLGVTLGGILVNSWMEK